MKSPRLRLLAALLVFLVPTWWVLHHSYPPLPHHFVFEAELAAGKPGLTGPLIVTGHPSAGDFLFIKWIEKNRVVFCYNSWGHPTVLESKPVDLQPGQRLALVISMPSIAPQQPGRDFAEKKLRVECNGALVLEATPHFYPVDSSALAFGENLFGKTLCGKTLPGKLYQREGGSFRGGPGSFFPLSARVKTWAAEAWWKVAGFFLAALIFHRLAQPLPHTRPHDGSFHALDDAVSRLARILFSIHAPVFTVGVITALVLLTLAGRKVSNEGYIANFERFYPHINPESYFYPSSSLLKSLAERETDPDKTLVLIGGSSVLNGVGQPTNQLWTRTLQKELGPNYQVINFAFRGGQPSDTGAVAAEMLRKQGRKVIYIADLTPGLFCEPDGGTVYRYIYWDAHYKGLLKEYPEREEYLRTRPLNSVDAELLEETKLAMWLNSIFYSLDFWTYVAYTRVSSVWTSWMVPFYEPRRNATDPEIAPGPLSTRYQQNQTAEMSVVRGTIDPFYSTLPPGQLDLNPDNPASFAKQNPVSFAPEIRPDTLFLTTGHSPFYRKQLSALEQERLRRIYRFQQKISEELGFRALDATGDLTEEDYVDRCHLSPSGGEKLAHLVAAKIKEMKTHEK